jgi:hypothetical protein
MFSQTSRLTGCVPVGVGTTDPAIIYAADFGSSDYYWVTYGPEDFERCRDARSRSISLI